MSVRKRTVAYKVSVKYKIMCIGFVLVDFEVVL